MYECISVTLAISVIILAAAFNACLPLCYEMTCESGYPIHEGIIGTIISQEINISAVVFLLIKLIPNIGECFNYHFPLENLKRQN